LEALQSAFCNLRSLQSAIGIRQFGNLKSAIWNLKKSEI